jgi:3-hydroxypropanoate dehydrogenase
MADVADTGNKPKIVSAPCVVLIGYDLDFPKAMTTLAPHLPGAVKWWPTVESRRFDGLRNSALQGAYLMIAARSLGLDCGPMGGFDREAADAEFFAGTRIKSNFIVALGRGTGEKLHPRAPRLDFDAACEIL